MRILLAAALVFARAGSAQSWEIGGAGGGAFAARTDVSSALGQAGTGFSNSLAAGGVIGQNFSPSVAGEIRYTFQPGELRISSGGSHAALRAQTHAIHYDVLFHVRQARASMRPFVAAGGGVRVFRGVGQETVYQPLQDYALLTKTHEWKPLISVGAGFKIALSPRIRLRLEFRDYATRFPKQVIVPVNGAKAGGWIHSITPLVGLSFLL